MDFRVFYPRITSDFSGRAPKLIAFGLFQIRKFHGQYAIAIGDGQ
ncbi:hypothetical protein CES85_2127 [Ochrobactrum quorumnocens]|uniref:Uncharacterized protein n=1 Tax=Ochrobactrum quorumnocens TaxID=271865 RepID=A0A248UHM8_9HYPH|nr:hypothetical protein CES85_2127 [[Ochrobactrum] quorumnocens]